MQRNTINTINRDFVFSSAFIARKAASLRRHRIFREMMIIIAVVCGSALLFDSIISCSGY